ADVVRFVGAGQPRAGLLRRDGKADACDGDDDGDGGADNLEDSLHGLDSQAAGRFWNGAGTAAEDYVGRFGPVVKSAGVQTNSGGRPPAQPAPATTCPATLYAAGKKCVGCLT